MAVRLNSQQLSLTFVDIGLLFRVIHRADYQKILLEEAEKLGARIITNVCVTDIDFETSTVKVGAGENKNIEADVIVGADGNCFRPIDF
jgi:salicylate hydroxylase